MYIKQFDNDIFIPLVITVGMTFEETNVRFRNMEKDHEGDWGTEEEFSEEAASVNLVKDLMDNGYYKILLSFRDRDCMTMRNITHESFHVAISMASYHNMSIGFNVGEDEHVAHIAGWSGRCCGLIWDEVSKEEENGKEEEER